MFEKVTPDFHLPNTRVSGSLAHVHAAPGVGQEAAHDGQVLRIIEWNELTARLNAARDLREVLRRDAESGQAEGTGGFANAAERYFRTREADERDVNSVALEHRKASPGMIRKADAHNTKSAQFRGHAATGDARDD